MEQVIILRNSHLPSPFSRWNNNNTTIYNNFPAMILRKQLRYTNARCVIYITGGKTRNKANPLGITPWVNYTLRFCLPPLSLFVFQVLSSQVISTLADLARPRHELLFFRSRLPLSLRRGSQRVSTPSSPLERSIHVVRARGMTMEDGRGDRWRRGEGRVKAATEEAIRNNEDEMGCRSISTLAAALLVGQSLLGSRRNPRYVPIFSP